MNLNNKIRLTKDIVLYKNFLTNEEAQKTISVLENQAKNEKIEWSPISFYESYSSILPNDNDEEIKNEGLPSTFFSDIKQGIIEAVASVHDIDNSKIVQIGYHAQKWEPGAYARIHSDNTDEQGNPSAFERSRYAGFLYLNDDFEGGLLNFPKNNIAIAPETGMLAVFSGGYENMHEVTLIEKGLRYTLGSFWDDREESEYPEELREQWKEEIKKVRDSQEKEKLEWKQIHEKGYKIDMYGKQYKVTEEQ
jgi:hypothetical protein